LEKNLLQKPSLQAVGTWSAKVEALCMLLPFRNDLNQLCFLLIRRSWKWPMHVVLHLEIFVVEIRGRDGVSKALMGG
jgi:hypothetical protein